MRFIDQPNGTISLLLGEDERMPLAHLLSRSAAALDDFKSGTLSSEATKELKKESSWIIQQQHKLAQLIAGDRSGELYNEGTEDDIEAASRAAGTACCADEEQGGPGWAAVEGATA